MQPMAVFPAVQVWRTACSLCTVTVTATVTVSQSLCVCVCVCVHACVRVWMCSFAFRGPEVQQLLCRLCLVGLGRLAAVHGLMRRWHSPLLRVLCTPLLRLGSSRLPARRRNEAVPSRRRNKEVAKSALEATRKRRPATSRTGIDKDKVTAGALLSLMQECPVDCELGSWTAWNGCEPYCEGAASQTVCNAGVIARLSSDPNLP